jgi:hypothetical protein
MHQEKSGNPVWIHGSNELLTHMAGRWPQFSRKGSKNNFEKSEIGIAFRATLTFPAHVDGQTFQNQNQGCQIL